MLHIKSNPHKEMMRNIIKAKNYKAKIISISILED